MIATMKIDGDKLTYREDGVLRFSMSENPDDTLVCIPRDGTDYREKVIRELMRRLKETFYACNVALEDLKDGCDDDGEAGEALRSAISEATSKHCNLTAPAPTQETEL